MKHLIYMRGVAATILLLLFATTGCNQWVEVRPRQSVDSSIGYNTPEALQAVLIGAYSNLKSARLYGRDLMAIPDALADNGGPTLASGRLNAEFNNQPGSHMLIWGICYSTLNNLTLLLENAPTVVTDVNQRNAMMGQAHFLRALLYFELARAYGYEPGREQGGFNLAVPIMRRGVIKLEDVTFSARNTNVEVYAFIDRELSNASVRLRGNAAAPTRVQQATLAAVYGLWSRVSLYASNLPRTIATADSALILAAGVGARFVGATDYVQSWRARVHPESLFEVAFELPSESIGVNESLMTTYFSKTAPGASRGSVQGFGDLVPTISFLNIIGLNPVAQGSNAGTITPPLATNPFSTVFYPPASPIPTSYALVDIRTGLYEIGSASRTGAARIECTKFTGRSGSLNLDNVPVIRVSEVILNRIEALARRGDLAAGQTAMNNFLAARYTLSGPLPAPALASVTFTTAEELLNLTLAQRSIELAFEGHRFYDMKRYSQDIIKSPVPGFGSPPANVTADDFRILAQIPTGELLANPNMVQNRGY